jgi:hypothetical protein
VPRIALTAAAVLLLAGCGGSSQPQVALLSGVRVEADRVAFAFRSPPRRVDVRAAGPEELVQDGSGRRVRVRGAAFLVVRFEPASGYDLAEDRKSYDGPARLPAAGRVREVVRLGDFEAVLTWAIGLDARRSWHVERSGDEVRIEIR